MQKEYTKLRKFYAWIGFAVCVGAVSSMVFGFIFMIWSLMNQDDLILLLTKIFG